MWLLKALGLRPKHTQKEIEDLAVKKVLAEQEYIELYKKVYLGADVETQAKCAVARVRMDKAQRDFIYAT